MGPYEATSIMESHKRFERRTFWQAAGLRHVQREQQVWAFVTLRKWILIRLPLARCWSLKSKVIIIFPPVFNKQFHRVCVGE